MRRGCAWRWGGVPPGASPAGSHRPPSRPLVFQKMVQTGVGDSFYIRTHFELEPSPPYGLGFTRGDVFHVLDTLYPGPGHSQARGGHWLAARMGRNLREQERGVIPSQRRWEPAPPPPRSPRRARCQRCRVSRGEAQGCPASAAWVSSGAVTSRHKLGGFKPRTFIISCSGDERCKLDLLALHPGAGRAGPSRRSRENRAGLFRLLKAPRPWPERLPPHHSHGQQRSLIHLSVTLRLPVMRTLGNPRSSPIPGA